MRRTKGTLRSNWILHRKCKYFICCLRDVIVKVESNLLYSIQSWPKKLVLGCVISPLRQQAESRNLMGHTFLAKSVVPFAFKL